ncbi:MAG TPA: proline dehydrogenase family protein [Thermoleophilia bacterium]|nr:proline dehydrogenase family protein [Thermoleophilia bacterium]
MLNLYRRAVLGVAAIGPVERWSRRHGWRQGARRFVAGESIDDALPTLRALAEQGRSLIVDVLGEYVSERASAEAMAGGVATTIETLARAGLPPVLSIKPTQLGLAFDPQLAAGLAVDLARRAEAAGGRVCLDMEDHRFVDGTLELLGQLRRAGAHRSSTVLQAYLHRTPADLEALLADAPAGSELRIVKGAYHEPAGVALHDGAAIRRTYMALCERAWQLGAKVNVATHDDGILREATAYVRGARLERERYELQLLYGVRPRLQQRLVDDGHPVRLYVPVGADWYGYFSRRLAERPANAAVVLRGILG